MADPIIASSIKHDCRHFKGAVPCKPHKEHGAECWDECKYYDPTDSNILIIKLGAIGDVVRSTPILHPLKKDHPSARIFWVSQFPRVLPAEVDHALPFTVESLAWLRSLDFKLGANLDKDPEACALLDQLQIDQKFGFGLVKGQPGPVNEMAVHKFVTGISDARSKANTKHYMEEIFEIMGWEYAGEEYILPAPRTSAALESYQPSRPVVGLNTGCSGRWPTRLWPQAYWIDLANRLIGDGYEVLLLGGPEEDEMNGHIEDHTGATYLGQFPLLEFLGLMDSCQVIVSSVTMAMHFALGLKKKLVLLNNIFNRHEFHLFGRGEILEPDRPCDCYYRSTCIHGESCMKDLPVAKVLAAVRKLHPR